MSGKPDQKAEIQLKGGSDTIPQQAMHPQNILRSFLPRQTLSRLLSLVCLVIVFFSLGRPALFEPDEGRNAEKAREILILGDWVTPHENFLPVLDKPMPYYWLIGLSYLMFGISEWSARLPSALAALGCLFLVYRFARASWGQWEALWSGLILVTSVEFFLLARIVILDMTLTFFITLALCSFYSAAHAEKDRARKFHCLLMYVALGGGTLVKGLVGIIIPGVVYFVYLLVTKRWSLLRKLYLLPGALFYLAVVAPWYIWADARNPGFLQYYLWDEHFARFVTDQFEHGERWYYFFFVLVIGFLPWVVLIPYVIKERWGKFGDKDLFLILWIILPFVFFSASKSQLPHYILPIFPPLAILTAQTIVARFKITEAKSGLLFLPWVVTAGCLIYLAIGTIWPNLLAREIRPAATEESLAVAVGAVLFFGLYGAFTLCNAKGWWRQEQRTFVWTSLSIIFFLFVVTRLLVAASLHRSAKVLAQNSASFLSPGSQLVFYDTYLAGLPFYLRIDRPIWVVTKKGKTKLMSSNYISRNLPSSAPGYGKVLLTFEEFSELWRQSNLPFRVFAKEKNLPRLTHLVGNGVQQKVQAEEYVLVSEK